MKGKLKRFLSLVLVAVMVLNVLPVNVFAEGHEHSYNIEIVTVPSCTEGGYSTFMCECGDSYVGAETGAAGHSEAVDEAVAPTETEPGLTEGSHCSVCGTVLVAQEEIPATGSDEPEDEPVEKHEHSYSTEHVTAPSCTEGGYTTFVCECGDSYIGDETSATGHSEVVDEAVAPTETESGLTEGSHCSVCGAVLVAQEEIPAVGNENTGIETVGDETTGDETVGDETTGDETADDETVGDETADDETVGDETADDETADDETIGDETTDDETVGDETADDETADDETIGDEATADEAVGDETVGDETVGDETTGDEIVGDEATADEAVGDETVGDETVGDETIGDEATDDEAAEGTECAHENTEPLAAVAATCAASGLTEGSKCSDCGEILSAQEEIPATSEHAYNEENVCSVCGTQKPEGDAEETDPEEESTAGEADVELTGLDAETDAQNDTTETDIVKKLPEAEVTVLKPLTLAAGDYMVWPSSGDATIDRPLNIVMNFKAKDTLEEAQNGGYGKWKTDFYLKVTGIEGDSMLADGCYLAGNYGTYGWIVIPTDGLQIDENVSYPIVSDYDPNLTYENICDYVKEFTAAIYIAPAILEANPDMKVELTLKMTNPDNEDETLIIGEPAVYDVDDLGSFVAKAGGNKYLSLPAAVEAAQAGDTVTLLKDVELTEYLKISKALTLNLNGKEITADFESDYGTIYVSMQGSLTIKGSGSVSSTASHAIGNYGTVKVEGGTFKAGVDPTHGQLAALYNFYYNGSTYGKSTIEGGTFKSPIFNCGELKISGGQMNVVDNSGKLTIVGGAFGGEIIDRDGGDAPELEDKGTIVISGGTFENAVEKNWCREGFMPVKNADGKYGVYKLPEAEVTVLEPLTLTEAEHDYMVWPSGDDTIDRPLNIVMNFKAKDTLEEAQNGGFGKWKTDFYLKLTGLANSSITADNCYLAGNYGEYGWIVIPADGLVIEDGVSYPVVSAYDANLTYENICDYVKDFTAAIYIAPAILEANPDIKVELTLKMTNPNNESETLVIGEPAVYDVDDLGNCVAEIDGRKFISLPAAIAAAQADDTVTLLDDIELTEGIVIAADKDFTLDLNGKTIRQTKAQTAGYQMILNDGILTIEDKVGGGKISYTDTGNGGEYISDTIYNRGTLVINGGTIENLSSATVAQNGYPHAVDTYSGIRDTSVTITGGTITCSEYSAIRMFCVSADNKADLLITGGTINGAVDMQNGTKNAAKGSLTVTGGTFNNNKANSFRFANWNGGAQEYGIEASIQGGTINGAITTAYVPAAANWDSKIVSGGTFAAPVAEAYCAEGYIPADNGDGTYGVKVGKYVARNTTTGVGYETLAAAIDAAQAGETVTLLKDVTLTGKLTISKNITIDGANHKIIANHTYFILETASDCTFKNVTLDTNNKAKGVKIASGSVVFDNVTIPNSNKSDAITVYGSLEIRNYFKVESSYQVFDASNGKVTVAPDTVFDFTSQIGLVSPATSDLSAAEDTEGNPYFEAFSSTAYYKRLSGILSAKDLTLLKDVELSANIPLSGTLNLNGHQLTIADGKSVNVNAGTVLDVVGEGGKINGLLKPVNTGLIFAETAVGATYPADASQYVTGEWVAVGYYDAVVVEQAAISRSLAAACGQAESGETILLMKDVTLTEALTLDKAVTLDLDGKNITGTVNVGAAVTLLNGTITGEIKLTTVDATLTGAEGMNVTTDIAEQKVVYENGVYKVVAKVYVAQVGETKYETLDEAIEAAQAGETVTLIKDIELTETQILETNIILDLNGKKLTTDKDACIRINAGSVTIMDGVGGGGIGTSSANGYGVSLYGSSTVTISGGSISGVSAADDSKAIITGGSFDGAVADLNRDGNSTITLTLAEGKTEGASFPGGITVTGTTLSEVLSEDMACWQTDKPVTITGGQAEITGDVVIKACSHADASYTDNGDGTHDQTCICGKVIVDNEAHSYGTNHLCEKCQSEEPVYVAFHSLSLKGNIGVNYYLHIDESIVADTTGYMRFITPRGGTVDIPIGQAEVRTSGGKTYYGFTATVAAKEMTDVVIGQYFYNGGSSKVKEYSVKAYADIILANEGFAKAQPLVRAMLNYGAYSQEHFGYNTENLACQTTDVSAVTAETLRSFAIASGQGTALVPLVSSSLILKTETTLRLIFQPAQSVTEMTVTYNGSELSVTKLSSYRYVNITNISAKNLDDNYTVTVNDGTETADVTYSPMAYCYNVLNAAEGTFDEKLQNTVRALYLYNQAANDYFN